VNLLKTGEVDAIQIDPQTMKVLENEPDIVVHLVPSAQWYSMYWHTIPLILRAGHIIQTSLSSMITIKPPSFCSRPDFGRAATASWRKTARSLSLISSRQRNGMAL